MSAGELGHNQVEASLLIEPREEIIEGIHDLWLEHMQKRPLHASGMTSETFLARQYFIDRRPYRSTEEYVAARVERDVASNTEGLIIAHTNELAVAGIARVRFWNTMFDGLHAEFRSRAADKSDWQHVYRELHEVAMQHAADRDARINFGPASGDIFNDFSYRQNGAPVYYFLDEREEVAPIVDGSESAE